MKKLITKTVALTVAIMMAIIVAIYVIFSLFLPASLGNVYFKINAENLSVKYSVKAYEKSQSVNDLAT